MTKPLHQVVRLLFVFSALAAFNGPALGQSIQFANAALGVNAPFYAANGTTRLAGNGFRAALYIGPSGASEDSLSLLGDRPFMTGLGAGYWVSQEIAAPNNTGQAIVVQVRFWDTQGGAYTNFAQAEAAGAEVGVSKLFELTLNPSFPPSATPMIGLQSASLVPVLTLTRGLPHVSTDTSVVQNGTQRTNLCGVAVGPNRWFRITSPTAGQALLTTIGSAIDTVVTAFTGSIANASALVPLACNDDRAPGQNASEVRFPIAANKLYLACAAGKNGIAGPVQLNYSLATVLDVRRLSGAGIELSWPSDATNFLPQTSPTPDVAGSWHPITNAPTITTNRRIVSLQISNASDYYRLRMNAPP